MTSRERVLAAIAHKEPDRVPVDMGATPSSGISAIAYSNLLKHLGRTDLPVQIYDVVQQLAQPGYVDYSISSVLMSLTLVVLLMYSRLIGMTRFWQMVTKRCILLGSIL